MTKNLKRYWLIWKLLAANALQETFVNRGSNILFMIGKIFRLAMTLFLLFLIKSRVKEFAGYTTDEIVIFFLTYQFIDVLAQVAYRGVYIFTHYVRHGEFDFVLTKPLSPLFQALTGKPDFNDALFIIPTTILSIWIVMQLEINITLASFLWYLLLVANGLLIATSLHILILCLGILTTEIDSATWLYRDLMQLGRFPVNIYLEPVRLALFFLVPVGMMITIPSEVLLNRPPTYSVILATLFGVGFFWFSLRAWRWSLKQYSSASS